MTIRRRGANIGSFSVTMSHPMKTLVLTLAMMIAAHGSGLAQVETPGTYGDAMRWYQRAAEARLSGPLAT